MEARPLPSEERAQERARAIESFVTQFLRSLGGKVETRGETVRVALGEEAARLLGCDPRLDLRFTPFPAGDGMGEPPGAVQYITYGHPLLDRMLEVARTRGRAANLLFTFSLEPDFVARALRVDPFAPEADGDSADEPGGPIAELRRRGARLRVEGARLRIAERRIVHQRQLLFFFKVSLISDERRELVKALLIDPVTEEVDRAVDVRRAVSSLPFWEDGKPGKGGGNGSGSRSGGGGGTDAYTLDRLYRRACEHLNGRLAPTMRAFERAAAERARDEIRRIEAYYRGLAEESLEPVRRLFRRIAAAGVRADLARTWQTQNRYADQANLLKAEVRDLEAECRREIEALRQEKERRLAEVEEKYRPRAEIALTHAAYVMVPRVEWRLRIDRRDEGAAGSGGGDRKGSREGNRAGKGSGSRTESREALVLYDLLRRTFVGWECEHCARSLLGGAHLCTCGALVCPACHAPCGACGGGRCALCAPASERCHLCGRPTCGACDPACPLGGRLAGIELPVVCARCRNEWCGTCIASALPDPFAAPV